MATFRERYAEKKKNQEKAQSFRERYTSQHTDFDTIAEDVKNRTNTWLKNHSVYIANYRDRYSKDEAYRGDSAEWYSTVSEQKQKFDQEAQNISSILDQYSGLGNDSWDNFAKEIKKILSQGESAQSTVTNRALQDDKFASQFTSREDYNKWDMGWLSENATVDLESSQKRKTHYKKNQGRIAELDQQISDLESTIYGSRIVSFSFSPYTSTGDSKENNELLKTLKSKRNALIAENNRYENEQKTLDDYYKPETEEFKQNAAYRDYKNIAVSDTAGYGVDKDTAWNTLSNGGYWDLEGNLRDKNGNVVGKSEDSFSFAMEDKLGTYLNTSAEDRVAIQNELQKFTNTDPLTTYQNMIFEAENGAWDQLTEGEINIYYDLYKTQGQEAAYKYLSDMKDVLNKRATQEQQEDIRNSEGWERFGWNVASIPMNVIGGATAFMDDAINVLSGNDVNPYSKAHLWQNMGQTVREETAKDWDDATGNIAIPWLDFSAGDVYQSLMSAADSVGGALAFGKGYSVLMGMGAASSKAKELYERGATKGQIVTGALLSGAAELVFESIGLDGLLKAAKAKNLKAVVGNALKQAGVEAFEETGTEIANAINEVLVMGDQSKYGTLDWGDASTFASDVVNATLGGFISGAAGGGAMALKGAKQAADYQSGVKAHGQMISDFGDVESLQKHAEAMIKDKNTPNAWEIKQQLKKVQGNSSAKNVGNLYAVMQDSVQKQNRKESVQQLKKEGLSRGQADSVYDAILQMEKSISSSGSDTARLAAEQKFVDTLAKMGLDDATQSAVATVAQDLMENPQNASQSRLRDLMNARVGSVSVDPQDVKTLSESLQKEIKTEGRISSDGKTYNAQTGEQISINEANPIAKIVEEDGERAVYLNTDQGEMQTSDIEFASEDDIYLYEYLSDLDAGTASIVAQGYDGSMPVLDYVQGMTEGILLYGKHNFQTVGADISEDGYFAGLSEADQQTALKLGRELRDEETRQRTARVREAIERAKAEREKSSETQKNTAQNGGEVKNQYKGTAPDGKKIYEANFPKGTPKAAKSQRILDYIQNVWSKDPITLVISNGETSREIQAQFDPTVPENPRGKTDATKIAAGNRHGSASEQRVTLDLADDYYEIASDARYNYSKLETGKDRETHKGVRMWHYFVNEIYFVEQGSDELTPYTVTINVKEKDNGSFVYSFNAEKDSSTRRTLHADVGTRKGTNGEIFFDDSIPQNDPVVKTEGKVFFDDSVELSELTEKQRAEVEYAGNVISAVIGNEIHFFDSRHVPADSREAKTNGWYDPSDGSIHLDIAKTESGEESVLFSLSHELVHFIDDWSPAKYQTFADFLLKNYAEHGVSTQKLLERKMAELKTNDADHAMSELVADACERMLLDSKASEKLAELNKTDKGIVAKIKSFLANTLKKIRQAYAQFKGREEAQLLQKMEDKLSEFHTLFEDALTAAAQNYRDADGKLDSAEVREQAKIVNRYGYDSLTSKSPMTVSKLQSVSESDYAKWAKDRYAFSKEMRENARKKGNKKNTGTNVYLYCDDLGKDVLVSAKSFGHGAARIDNTYVSVCRQIGDILENSIIVNELQPRENSDNSYVALGLAETETDYVVVRSLISQRTWELTSYEILYAIKKESINKKMLAYSPRITLQKSGSTTSSSISITDFLQIVKGAKLANSVLSDDVLKNLNEQRISDQNVTPNLKYQQKQTSNRAVLADLLESSIDTSTPEGVRQADLLDEYRANIGEIEDLEDRVRALSADIKAIAFSTGKRDMDRYNRLIEERNRAQIRLNQLERDVLKIEALGPVKALFDRQKADLRKKYEKKGRDLARQAVDSRVESIQKRDARLKLEKLIRDTDRWLQSPKKSDVKCPDVLQQPMKDFISCIDFSSPRRVINVDSKWEITGAVNNLANTIGKIVESQNPGSENQEDLLSSGYLDLPKDFAESIRDVASKIGQEADLAKAKGGNAFEMDLDEIHEITKILRTLRHSIREMQSLYTNYRYANATALGQDTIRYVDSLGEDSGIANGLRSFAVWDNATPYYAFRRFGAAGESVMESLMDAQDKLAFLSDEIFKFKEKTWTDKEAREWSKTNHKIELADGQKLELTTADAMSVYCLWQRKQGKQHLLGGGIRVLGSTDKGKKKTDGRVTLTEQDVQEIIGVLGKRQIEVADKMQAFMSTVCAEWGNEISMKRFLTKMYNEKFYFPIETDPDDRNLKDPSAQQSDLFRLLNISASKQLTPNANNKVVIRSIFDVFANHTSDMAKMNSFGMALLDFMKWINYHEKGAVKDDGRFNTKSVQSSMRTAFGDSAKNYVLNLIKDVNGRGNVFNENRFAMRMIRASKTASVGANLRVAALQLTSLPRAGSVLQAKNVLLGMKRLPQTEKAMKYCGIALWKSFGFYDTNINKSVEAQIKGDSSVTNKIVEWSLKGAELGDCITWGILWNACEYEVAQTKQYAVGSEAFNEAVGKKLREVIYATQVVDSTLTRSQIMRSKSGMNQMLTSFMSEPTLTYNLMLDCLSRFSQAKKRSGSAKQAWESTKRPIVKTTTAFMVTTLLVAMCEAIADGFRDDDDEPYPDKFFEAFWQNLLTDINLFNKIPIARDIVSFFEDKIGYGYYNSSRLDSEYLNTLSKAFDAWVSIFNKDASDDKTVYYAIYNTAKGISQFTGLPINNAMREVVSLWNNTAGSANPNLKVRTWNPSASVDAENLLKAIERGDQSWINDMMKKFSSEEDLSKAMKPIIASKYRDEDLDYDAAVKYLKEYCVFLKDGKPLEGADLENEIYWYLEKQDYAAEHGSTDGYTKYDDFIVAVETDKDLKTTINRYMGKGISADSLASQITSHFKPIYQSATNVERARLKGYLLNAYELLGKNRADKSKDIDKWLEVK